METLIPDVYHEMIPGSEKYKEKYE